MKKVLVVFLLILVSTIPIFAGDSAAFVNLGFSPDGKYFMFGQYGLQPARGKAYSELYLVDVNGNVFVAGGSLKGEYGVSFDPGQSALGALINLLEGNVSLKERYKIDHLMTGRLLYLEVEVPPEEGKDSGMESGDNSSERGAGSDKTGESLEFRDFVTGRVFKMSLVQSVEGEGRSLRSSFYILMEVTDSSGLVQTYTVGHPNFKRNGITAYRVSRVIAGPDKRSLVVIIAKEDGESNVRFMVETLRLK